MNETRPLIKQLFIGYNKHTHPRLPGTGPVTVTFDFQLIDILDLVSSFQLKTAFFGIIYVFTIYRKGEGVAA